MSNRPRTNERYSTGKKGDSKTVSDSKKRKEIVPDLYFLCARKTEKGTPQEAKAGRPSFLLRTTKRILHIGEIVIIHATEKERKASRV